VADTEERSLTAAEIKAQIAAARQRRDATEAAPRTARTRRQAEHSQRKTRVNGALLRGESSAAHEERWTIRARPERIRAVKQLSKDLSQPRSKMTIAQLMDEAIGLLLEKYRNQEHTLDA
jgi:hypothetical protein